MSGGVHAARCPMNTNVFPVFFRCCRREVKARKAANKAAKGSATAMKAKPSASKQKGGNTKYVTMHWCMRRTTQHMRV